MSRKPLGERPMTDAERQARYRAARAAARPVIRFRRPADHRSRAKRWRDDGRRAGSACRPNIKLGSTPCRKRCRTRQRPRRCGQSAIWTSRSFRPSSRREASDATEPRG